MTPIESLATNLFCPQCEAEFDLDTVINLCRCGSPLLVGYDLSGSGKQFLENLSASDDRTIYRYQLVLPVGDKNKIVSLGEGGTHLLKSNRIGPKLNLNSLYFKDESTNPTGSFKARGLSMAVTRARELGLKRLIVPTAGNAGSALAAYCARAGMQACIVMPDDVPSAFRDDCRQHGAIVHLIPGNIADCSKIVADKVADEGWFSVATLKEPYRIEGKKTMGYELAEQFDYELPDLIIYPTGGGTGLIGMWKAFGELQTMGLLRGPKPKMVVVQSDGCAPMVRAFNEGHDKARPWSNPKTIAAGLRVPSAIGDFLILKAVRESGGTAVAVSETEIIECTKMLATEEGIFSSPEGGAALACLQKLLAQKFISQKERIVLFITGSGYKYL